MSSRALNLGRMITSRNPSAPASWWPGQEVLRRTGSGETEAKSGGLITLADELVIDTERHRVSVRGETLNLTVTEFGILKYLAGRPGFVRTRDQIISAVHGEHHSLQPYR